MSNEPPFVLQSKKGRPRSSDGDAHGKTKISRENVSGEKVTRQLVPRHGAHVNVLNKQSSFNLTEF